MGHPLEDIYHAADAEWANVTAQTAVGDFVHTVGRPSHGGAAGNRSGGSERSAHFRLASRAEAKGNMWRQPPPLRF